MKVRRMSDEVGKAYTLRYKTGASAAARGILFAY
jgi:hypothetical protein